MDSFRTVVISCAGMGNRLGLGTTKALVEVDGKPLIIRHLEYLKDEKDVRVVVGYQAESVIEVVRAYRDDVMFVFNRAYRETGTGASLSLAARYANRYVLSIDGDLVVHPDDMMKILKCEHEFVGGNVTNTDDPWMLQTFRNGVVEYVSAFSKCRGDYEWNGIVQIQSDKILNGKGHVFHLIEPHLPIRFMNIRTKEIDTINDYERANAWVKNGFCD